MNEKTQTNQAKEQALNAIQNLKTTNELLVFIANKHNISLGTLLNDNGACIQDVIDNNNALIDSVGVGGLSSGGWVSMSSTVEIPKDKPLLLCDSDNNYVIGKLVSKKSLLQKPDCLIRAGILFQDDDFVFELNSHETDNHNGIDNYALISDFQYWSKILVPTQQP